MYLEPRITASPPKIKERIDILNKKRILFFIIIILLICSITVSAAEEIMPLNEVKAGMQGYGKTVFSGTEVEKFPVEIIDVLKNRGISGDLILVKTYGDKIEKIGGIAAGMSGSPVYIDDRMVGAIAYGWSFSDHRYGLVTPVEDMLDLLEKIDLEEEINSDLDNRTDLKNSRLNLAKNLAASSSPLMVSGLNGRALEMLKDDLSHLNLKVLPNNGIKESDKSTVRPEAGEAIAVQLVRGDINVASIGTLSYIDQNKVIAFGHPFTNRGEVDYLLSRAYINGIVPSEEQPFKLGSPYSRLIGSITQDRGAGIAGRLGQYPHIIPLHISISENNELKEEISLQIVNDEFLLTSLANSAALQAVDSSLDRIGPGTARSRLKIMGKGLPDLQIISTNMYYSQKDIGSMALYDFYQLLNLIARNPFKDINLIDIRLELDFQKTDSVALIQEAKVLNDEIYPGDEVEVKVTLHPYRSDVFTRNVSIKLPDDVEKGVATLFIDGGYTGETARPEDAETQTQSAPLNEAEVAGHKSFESMLKEYMKKPDNNDLIVQVYPAYNGSEYTESSYPSPECEGAEKTVQDEKREDNMQKEKAEKEEKGRSSSKEEIKEIFSTDHVLEGSLNLEIEIKEKDTAESSEGEISAKDEP